VRSLTQHWVVQLALVRHGHAGSKDEWRRADKLRPLSPRGHRQAEWLCDLLVPFKPVRILSSPHLRCIQTVQPLADRLELEIERSRALTPNAPTKALTLVRELSASGTRGGLVVCTHGEIMGSVLAELSKVDGVRVERRLPGLKGCVWFLTFRGGRLVEARYERPPI
jgi:8-oxo-(d)GTP phosphatase